jgi:hypothetical protein
VHFAILPLLGHKDLVNYVCLNSAQFFGALHSARKLTLKHNHCVVISCEHARKNVVSKCASGIFLGSCRPLSKHQLSTDAVEDGEGGKTTVLTSRAQSKNIHMIAAEGVLPEDGELLLLNN